MTVAFTFFAAVVLIFYSAADGAVYSKKEDKTKCPVVKILRHYDFNQIIGYWYVIEYYASSEELPEYSCMRVNFTSSVETIGVFMNFTYSYIDDPDRELLYGNISWIIPDPNQPAHWIHAEDTYEGVYNTYVLDSDPAFALLLHCAEKSNTTRYLSVLILSRTTSLKPNELSYLRHKLPRYDIDLEYMFPMTQNDCPKPPELLQISSQSTKKKRRKNLIKHRRRETNSSP